MDGDDAVWRMRRLLVLSVLVAAFAAFSLVPSAVSQTEGTTITLTNERFVCLGALTGFGPLPITLEQRLDNSHQSASHPRGAVELSGCFGDGDPDTTDLIIHQYGNGTTMGTAGDAVVVRAFSHDLTIEGFANCGWIDPGEPDDPNDEAHQDGFDIRVVEDLLIRDFELGDWETQTATCQGAGGLFYPSAFLNGNPNGPDDDPALVQRVVCLRCKMVAWKPADPEAGQGGRAAFIVQSIDSGAVDSCFSARLPFQIDARAVRPIDENNMRIDRDSTDPQPTAADCPLFDEPDPPPTTTEEPPTTTEPPPTTTVEEPPPYDPECAPTCDERIDELQAALLLALADLDQARQDRVDCRRKLSAVNKRFHAGRGVYSLHRPIHWLFGCTGFQR